MGRPKAVNLKTFPLYNLLHTVKTKMMCGVTGTTLYPIKETEHFYLSIEVWASCASTFKMKKKNVELNVSIPVITDADTKLFLAKHCWDNRVEEEMLDGESDMCEAVALLKKQFPEHKLTFFYELDSIINTYQWGNLETIDDNGKPVAALRDRDIKQQKYYNSKYNRFTNFEVPEIKILFDTYNNETNEAKKGELFTKYYDADVEYSFKHSNVIPQLIQIGRNAVCYPVAFTKGTANWYKEKYGKAYAYAHAGEIMFVVTSDTVYFEIKRHY